jgi:N utilization substance protein B
VSARRTAPRQRSRQVALQVLYAADVGGGGRASSPSVDEVFEQAAQNFELPEGTRAFAKELVSGVASAGEELDALLACHTRNWKVPRMAAVDRNILRLGAYELTHTDTPTSVILDEAIELARRFGAEPSPGFVNGVLDAVARQVRSTGEPHGQEADATGKRAAPEDRGS